MVGAEDFRTKQDTGLPEPARALPTEGLSMVPGGRSALPVHPGQHPSPGLPSPSCHPYLLPSLYRSSVRPAFFRKESGSCLQGLLPSHLQDTRRVRHLPL